MRDGGGTVVADLQAIDSIGQAAQRAFDALGIV